MRSDSIMVLNAAGPVAPVAGVDVPKNVITHTADNFAERRASQAGAGVSYDPDSLLTGEEMAAGLDYDDLRDRGNDWQKIGSSWQRACAGELTQDVITLQHPRRKGLRYTADGNATFYQEGQNGAIAL